MSKHTLSVRFLLLSAVLGVAASCATTPVSAPTAAPQTTAPVPLIDRELLFGDPEIAGGQLSPDGAFIAFIKPHQNVMNVWVKKREEPPEAARPLTADARPVTNFFFSRDGKLLLYVQDKGGDENFHLYAVDPRAAAEASTGVPPARDLTPGPKLRAEIVALPKKAPDSVLVALNERDPKLFDVYRVSLSTGKRELVRENRENIAGWTADLDGNLRLGTRVTDSGGTEVLRVGAKGLELLYSCSAEESCGPLRFHKDGKRVYFESNKGTEDLSRLLLVEVATGKEEVVEGDPEKQVDFGGADFSEATDELAATFYTGDKLRIYPKLADFKLDLERLQKALPERELSVLSRSSDDRFQLIGANSDVDPGAVYFYDRTSGKTELLYRPRPKLPVAHLAPMKPVRITARDGVTIPAYLTLPRTGGTGPQPAVVFVHGGPWARDEWGYSSYVQFLANRGYVVLQPNFRGSTGYGKKFLNLGNGQWGTGTMQHDLTDVAAWLVKQGHAAPGKVAIMGGSYGGYATLAGLAFTPDVWAAGVDIVGPSSIVTLLNSIPPYWAPIRKMFAVRVGDVEKATDVERLKVQSPLYSAKQMKAPLLVIQGANDPRVKQAESDQIVMALRDLGRPIEYLVAPDEGHGFRGRENRLAMLASIERFLSKHLGGRAQMTMPPDIEKRLAALTIDPATVKLADAAPPAPPPVFSAKAMKPTELRYRMVGKLGAQPIEGTSVVSVKKAVAAKGVTSTGGWSVASTDKVVPLGESTDVTTLDPKTLLPLTRTMKQGPTTVAFEYAGTAVKGTIEAQGRQLPFEGKGTSVLMPDGAAMGVAISTLPLAQGYRTTMSTFDFSSGKVAEMRLAVVSAEKVNVPAGSFDTWKVEVSQDGRTTSTLWFEKTKSRRMVKAQLLLPAGQGQLDQELTK